MKIDNAELLFGSCSDLTCSVFIFAISEAALISFTSGCNRFLTLTDAGQLQWVKNLEACVQFNALVSSPQKMWSLGEGIQAWTMTMPQTQCTYLDIYLLTAISNLKYGSSRGEKTICRTCLQWTPTFKARSMCTKWSSKSLSGGNTGKYIIISQSHKA